jgi:hypothetical protein
VKDTIYKVTTYFCDEDCGGDYGTCAVILNGKVLIHYGDYYHDKGDEKAEGFIAGFIKGSINKFALESIDLFVGEDNYCPSNKEVLDGLNTYLNE